MAIKCFMFALLVSFVLRASGNKCILETESGKLKSECCADFEAKGDDCVACSIGYTSHIGKYCRPCPQSTYGDRCRYDCSCSVFQICDIIKGCVETKTVPTEINDTTTTQMYLDGSTHVTNTQYSVKGNITTETIINLTLSGIVLAFGICLCLILFKYKSAINRKKFTDINTPIPLSSQDNHTIEIEEGLYEIINDADILDDQHFRQMQTSPEYLDVISASTSTTSGKSKIEVNDFHCHLLSSTETKMNDIFLNDNVSLSDEGNQETTEDYLNPYQTVIQVSPPTRGEYLKLTPVFDSSLPHYKPSTVGKKSRVFRMTKEAVHRPSEYENVKTNIGCVSILNGLVSMSYENLRIKSFQMDISSAKSDTFTNLTDNNMVNYSYCNILKSKSESDIYRLNSK